MTNFKLHLRLRAKSTMLPFHKVERARFAKNSGFQKACDIFTLFVSSNLADDLTTYFFTDQNHQDSSIRYEPYRVVL